MFKNTFSVQNKCFLHYLVQHHMLFSMILFLGNEKECISIQKIVAWVNRINTREISHVILLNKGRKNDDDIDINLHYFDFNTR